MNRQSLAETLMDESPEALVQANFAALLQGTDFTAELEILGIGRMQFMRRRQMLVELRGLYMGLWRLALDSSFPHDADAIFADFLRAYAVRYPDKVSGRVLERAEQYWGMLQAKGKSDFSDVARHLCSFAPQEQGDARARVLRLVLLIRNAYTMIFDRLI